VVDTLGLASNFYFFALLNLAGAALVYFTIQRVQPMHAMPASQTPFAATLAHWRNPALRAAFGIGFCILFAFIGIFTYVNFVLARPPLSLGRMDLGFVYFVFLPSIVTTLLAGKAVTRFGTRPAIWGALALAAIGLPLLLSSHLAQVLTGMVLVGVGTFFAQASATGFVGQAASENRGVASGTYLACYFLGGLVGSAVLGQMFDHFGWIACVAGVAASLALAGLLATRLTLPPMR
jgi:predicted MFS family arabinose efflux permease